MVVWLFPSESIFCNPREGDWSNFLQTKEELGQNGRFITYRDKDFQKLLTLFCMG